MAKIIGVSGAHGAGKSTLLNALSEAGYTVDTLKVSRHVQDMLGYSTLSEAVECTPSKMMAFEEVVFSVKYNSDTALKERAEDVIFVERTFADTAAYAGLWVQKFIEKDAIDISAATEWLAEFYNKCERAQEECYDGIILVPMMDCIVFEDDVKRADRESADKIFDLVQHFTLESNKNVLVIQEQSTQGRLKSVLEFIQNFKGS